MNIISKKTGKFWSKILKIKILNPKGWDNENQYNNFFITKEEFCNRAANSEILVESNLSRRDAARYAKRKLNK